MFKMLIIAAAFVGGLLYFGVLDDAGEIVTEMLPEAAQRYSPSDAESDSRSPPQSLLSLSTCQGRGNEGPPGRREVVPFGAIVQHKCQC